MIESEPARATSRPIPRVPVAGLIIVASAMAAVLGSPMLSTSTAPAPVDVLHGDDVGRPAEPPGEPRRAQAKGGAPSLEPRRERRGDEAGGVLPDGATAFDDDLQGIAKLDVDLLAALRRATTDAARDGVELDVDSGWRSRGYQERLLQQAISDYGSEAAAARWVATAETSPHVAGDAVDVGPLEASSWLSEHGAAYGLCQIFRNEPWHFESRPRAVERGCPRMYADPTRDPRMRH